MLQPWAKGTGGESSENDSLVPPVKPSAGLTKCDGRCLPLRATRSTNMPKAVFLMVPPRLALISGGVRAVTRGMCYAIISAMALLSAF